MDNPLRSLVPDRLYEELLALGLLNHYRLRDIEIKRKYRKLRARQIKLWDAIALLQVEYPTLQEDTIRKIVYRRSA